MYNQRIKNGKQQNKSWEPSRTSSVDDENDDNEQENRKQQNSNKLFYLLCPHGREWEGAKGKIDRERDRTNSHILIHPNQPTHSTTFQCRKATNLVLTSCSMKVHRIKKNCAVILIPQTPLKKTSRQVLESEYHHHQNHHQSIFFCFVLAFCGRDMS